MENNYDKKNILSFLDTFTSDNADLLETLHIIQENAIENPIELSKKIYSTTEWIPDPHPDLCPEIYIGENTKFLSEFEALFSI